MGELVQTETHGDAANQAEATLDSAARAEDGSVSDPDAERTVDDASRADASRADAGVGDASVQSDASSAQGCAKRAYKLCEDFESAAGAALPSGWSTAFGWGGGTPSVVSDEHHWGNKALRSASASDGQVRASRSLSALGATAGKHWGRVFYKVKSPATLPKGGDVIHSTLVGLLGASESRVVDTVIDSAGKHQFLYNLPDDSCCAGTDYDYSFDGRWHCAEWYLDQASQSFRFFYDGSEVTALAFQYNGDRKARIEAYESIALGLMNYQPTSPANMAWLDDLAIDDTRIGCE